MKEGHGPRVSPLQGGHFALQRKDGGNRCFVVSEMSFPLSAA